MGTPQILLLAEAEIGSVFVFLLAFRWRQRRGSEKKKKRG